MLPSLALRALHSQLGRDAHARFAMQPPASALALTSTLAAAQL